MKKEKEKFTNVNAPKVSEETHFHVEELDIGQEETDAKASSGFSFGFNFVPEEKEASEDSEEESENENSKPVEKQKAKIISKVQTPKNISTGEKFNLFKESVLTPTKEFFQLVKWGASWRCPSSLYCGFRAKLPPIRSIPHK